MPESATSLEQATTELRNVSIHLHALDERIRSLESLTQQLTLGQDGIVDLHSRLGRLSAIVREENSDPAGSLLSRVKGLERGAHDQLALRDVQLAWWSRLGFEVAKWAVLVALGATAARLLRP